MREKYIEEYFNGYLFEFGKSSNGDAVDLADLSDMTIVSNIIKSEAEKLQKRDKKFMEFILKVNKLSPETIERIIYEDLF